MLEPPWLRDGVICLYRLWVNEPPVMNYVAEREQLNKLEISHGKRRKGKKKGQFLREEKRTAMSRPGAGGQGAGGDAGAAAGPRERGRAEPPLPPSRRRRGPAVTKREGERGRRGRAQRGGKGRAASPGGARWPLPGTRGSATLPASPECLTWAAPAAALAPRGERRRGGAGSRGRHGGRGGDGGRRRRPSAARPPVPQPQQPAHGADDGAGGQELPARPSAPAGSPQRIPAPGGPDPPLHARTAARPPHAGCARSPSGTVPRRPRGFHLLRPAPAPRPPPTDAAAAPPGADGAPPPPWASP